MTWGDLSGGFEVAALAAGEEDRSSTEIFFRWVSDKRDWEVKDGCPVPLLRPVIST